MAIGFLELAQQCAPMTDSAELAAIVSVESGFNPFNVRVGTDKALREQPRNKAEAIAIATSLQVDGELVDLGLGGLTMQSLGQLGLTVADAFDPCRNIAATARLIETYYAAARVGGSTDPKRDALRAYAGRGDPEPGRITGYDRQIESQKALLEPRMSSLTLHTGTALHGPETIGSVREFVASVDGAPQALPVTGAQEPPQGNRSFSPALTQPEETPASPQDVFSSTRNSTVFIFRR